MKYEEILERVGSFGRYQKLLCLLIIYAAIPNSLMTYMFVYNHRIPEFRCRIPGAMESAYQKQNATRVKNLYNYTIPWAVNELGEKENSTCEMYNNTETHRTVIPCEHGYEYDSLLGENSAAMEFNLVCENAWKLPLAVSLYLGSKMLGSAVGKLSDRFGRRPIFLIATLGQFLSMGFLGFTWNFESYAAGCILCGTFGLINYVAAYVLSLEMVSPRRRIFTGLLSQFGFTVGGLIVPLLGYFLRDWRWYMWITGSIGIFYIPLYWITPESARWLIVIGKEKEAKILLARMANVNGKRVNVNDFFVEKIDLTDVDHSHVNVEQESSLLFVLRHAQLRPRYFALCFGWFVCSMTYYAITLNPSNLSGDRFLNLFLLMLIEIPALGAAYFVVKFIGIPRSFFLFMAAAGVGCVIAPFILKESPEVTTFVVLVSKGAITAVFTIVYLGTLENSPTLVRNASTSAGSFFARLGSILSPYLLYAGSQGMVALPYLIMGGMALISAILGILFVPETIGDGIPDTVQEALENKRYYRLNLCKKISHRKY